MEFKVGLKNVRALERRMRDTVMAEGLREPLKETANILETEMKKESPVDTGAMRDSIEVEINDRNSNQLNATWTVGVPYAKFVIYGTRFQQANNFPRRAINRRLPEVIDDITMKTREYLDEEILRKRGKE